MNTPQGLPFRPGQPISEQLADGLIPHEDQAAMEPLPPDELPDALEHQKAEALRQHVASHAATPRTGSTDAADPNPRTTDAGEPVSVSDVLQLGTAAQSPVEERRKAACTKCGWDTRGDFNVEPTVADRQSFMRAVLTEVPFEKTYTLLDGQLLVTFATPDVRHADIVAKHVRWQASIGNIDVRLLMVAGIRAAMAMSITRVEVRDGNGAVVKIDKYPSAIDEPHPPVTYRKTDDSACDRAHAAIFEKMSQIKYELIYRQYVLFERLCQKLQAHADDPDFWKATPSVT